MKHLIALPPGCRRNCPCCGGTPIFSEDLAAELPFRAECHLHPEKAVYTLGKTLDEVIARWNDAASSRTGPSQPFLPMG